MSGQLGGCLKASAAPSYVFDRLGCKGIAVRCGFLRSLDHPRASWLAYYEGIVGGGDVGASERVLSQFDSAVHKRGKAIKWRKDEYRQACAELRARLQKTNAFLATLEAALSLPGGEEVVFSAFLTLIDEFHGNPGLNYDARTPKQRQQYLQDVSEEMRYLAYLLDWDRPSTEEWTRVDKTRSKFHEGKPYRAHAKKLMMKREAGGKKDASRKANQERRYRLTDSDLQALKDLIKRLSGGNHHPFFRDGLLDDVLTKPQRLGIFFKDVNQQEKAAFKVGVLHRLLIACADAVDAIEPSITTPFPGGNTREAYAAYLFDDETRKHEKWFEDNKSININKFIAFFVQSLSEISIEYSWVSRILRNRRRHEKKYVVEDQ